MSTIELRLDELTYARAKRLANEKNVSVEALVSEAIERLAVDRAGGATHPTLNGGARDRARVNLPVWNLGIDRPLRREDYYDGAG